MEVAQRVTEEGRAVLLVINHRREPAALTLPAPPLPAAVRDLLTGETFTATLPLPP
jgi:hypothetical protein